MLRFLFTLLIFTGCASNDDFYTCINATAQYDACLDDAYEDYEYCWDDCWTNSCREVCNYEYDDDVETCDSIESQRMDAC